MKSRCCATRTGNDAEPGRWPRCHAARDRRSTHLHAVSAERSALMGGAAGLGSDPSGSAGSSGIGPALTGETGWDVASGVFRVMDLAPTWPGQERSEAKRSRT